MDRGPRLVTPRRDPPAVWEADQNCATVAGPRNLDSLSWITKDGYLDMLKVPLESTYTRACGDDPQAARDALGVLPAELIGEKLDVLAHDGRFSPRMRAKLRACRLETERHGGRRAGLPPAA